MMKAICCCAFLLGYFQCLTQEMENLVLQWQGDTSSVNISGDNIFLDATEVGSSLIDATINSFEGYEYSFQLSLDFNPSSSNRFRHYLSYHPNYKLYIELGESGSEDPFYLISEENSHRSILDQTALYYGEAFDSLSIQVHKLNNEVIAIINSDSLKSTLNLMQDSIKVGFEFFYTSSNITSTSIFDFKGRQTHLDKTPPFLESINWIDRDNILLDFSEKVRFQNDVFSSQIILHKDFLILENQLFTLNIEISDRNENFALIDTSFYPSYIDFQQCSFNELMIDPTPTLGVYEKDYVELINISGRPIYNTQIVLVNNEDSIPFHIDSWLNDSILLIEDVNLNNDSFTLKLLDVFGALIDQFEYDARLFSNKDYSSGGWSLEKKNPKIFGSYFDTWSFNKSLNGGSKGLQNFSYCELDIDPPYIELVEVIESDTLYHFNEPIYSAGEIYNSVKSLVDLCDLSGNLFIDTNFRLNPFRKIVPEDLVINEILFKESDSIPEFIEIKNLSDDNLLIEDLVLAQRKDGQIIPMYNFRNKLILKGEIFTVTAKKFLLKRHPYSSRKTMIQDLSFPSFLSEEMNLVLITREGYVIDEVVYESSWFDSGFNKDDGYSIERVSSNGVIETSWVMASETVCYASPGIENSKKIEERNYSFNLIESRIFDSFKIRYSGVYDELIDIALYYPNGQFVGSLETDLWLSSSGVLEISNNNYAEGFYLLNILVKDNEQKIKTYNLSCYID